MRPLWIAAVSVLVAASLRTQIDVQATPRGPPSGAVAIVATLGHSTLASSVIWMRTVDLFVSEAIAPAQIDRAVHDATELDATWRIPWVYGALMLQSSGDFARQEALLEDAMAQHPSEAWFPYALGMSRLEHYHDALGAADWLDHAASMPGSPDVHAAAADALRALH